VILIAARPIGISYLPEFAGEFAIQRSAQSLSSFIESKLV